MIPPPRPLGFLKIKMSRRYSIGVHEQTMSDVVGSPQCVNNFAQKVCQTMVRPSFYLLTPPVICGYLVLWEILLATFAGYFHDLERDPVDPFIDEMNTASLNNGKPSLQMVSSKKNSVDGIYSRAGIESLNHGKLSTQLASGEIDSVRGIYSKARTDRSGAVIRDMLMAHAYAFHHNLTYAGACNPDPDKLRQKRMKIHIELLEAIGLQNVLKFACPKNEKDLISSNKYTALNTHIWTPSWKKHIQGLVQYPPNRGNANVSQVAVHIRRGDISPCAHHGDRYLPNSHYLTIIDK